MIDTKLENLFLAHGGQLRMSQVIAEGISRSTLYAHRDRGALVQVSRGLYRLATIQENQDPDLGVVCLRYPRAVICLISALFFHDLTTQIPHEISIALPRGSRVPGIVRPPIRTFLFSHRSWETGIVEHAMDGVRIRVYNPEKTLADCFKFRNKIGMDVFLEALRLYKEAGHTNPARLMEYSRICDVEKAMFPYLEAGL